MFKIRKRSFFILCILVILLLIVLLNEIVIIGEKNKIYNITIITESEINEGSITLKAGADKAAEETNVDIRFISLSKEDFIEEQNELLLNENNEETDAILIAPIGYRSLKDTIEKVNKNIPVILLQTRYENDYKINCVVFDNYNIGIDIGNEVLSLDCDKKKVAIVTNELNSDLVEERCNGITSILKGNVSYDIVQFKKDKYITYYDQAKQLISSNEANIIVAFDTETLESISQAKSDLLKTNTEVSNIKIYGSGNTRKIISFLDQNIINGIALENQFNIGYLGVKNALNFIRNHKFQEDVISSKIITRDNMYSIENQRLLFLFIR